MFFISLNFSNVPERTIIKEHFRSSQIFRLLTKAMPKDEVLREKNPYFLKIKWCADKKRRIFIPLFIGTPCENQKTLKTNLRL